MMRTPMVISESVGRFYDNENFRNMFYIQYGGIPIHTGHFTPNCIGLLDSNGYNVFRVERYKSSKSGFYRGDGIEFRIDNSNAADKEGFISALLSYPDIFEWFLWNPEYLEPWVAKMKVKITLTAEMSEEALKFYPPDECGRENLWHFMREAYLDNLSKIRKLEIERSKDIGDPRIIGHRIVHKEVDIEIGKQFDENMEVEYIE